MSFDLRTEVHRPHDAFGFLCVPVNHGTQGFHQARVCMRLSPGVVTAVTMWRCPACALILVGPQTVNAETHYATHKEP